MIKQNLQLKIDSHDPFAALLHFASLYVARSNQPTIHCNKQTSSTTPTWTFRAGSWSSSWTSTTLCRTAWFSSWLATSTTVDGSLTPSIFGRVRSTNKNHYYLVWLFWLQMRCFLRSAMHTHSLHSMKTFSAQNAHICSRELSNNFL